jgi:hypothetical protein
VIDEEHFDILAAGLSTPVLIRRHRYCNLSGSHRQGFVAGNVHYRPVLATLLRTLRTVYKDLTNGSTPLDVDSFSRFCL